MSKFAPPRPAPVPARVRPYPPSVVRRLTAEEVRAEVAAPEMGGLRNFEVPDTHLVLAGGQQRLARPDHSTTGTRWPVAGCCPRRALVLEAVADAEGGTATSTGSTTSAAVAGG